MRGVNFLTALILALTPASAYAEPSSIYFFGDSLTDEGRAGQTAPVMWPSVFLADTGIEASTNYAIGGAFTSNQPSAEFGDMSFLGQVNSFVASHTPIGPNPAAGIWIGTNNIWIRSGQGVPPGTIASNAATDVATGIKTLVGDGVHQIVLLGVYDLSLTNAYYLAGDSTLAVRAAAAAASQQYNSQLSSLSAPGANIQYFNIANFINHLMINPQTYGYTQILPLMPGQTCNSTCQQTSIFTDTIHLTSKTQTLIGNYVASGDLIYQNANFTYGAIADNVGSAMASAPLPAEMALSSTQNFVNSLYDRLEASRDAQAGYMEADGQSMAGPSREASPWSVFSSGDLAAVSPARLGPMAGYNSNIDYYSAAASIGVQYQFLPGLRLGAAFDYGHSVSDLTQTIGSRTSIDAYQVALYASLSLRNWFADGIVAAGADSFKQTRSGTFGQVSAAPAGGTFTASDRVGYLPTIGPVRAGPVLGLTYSRAALNAYAESGAAMSTMTYGGQIAQSLEGSGGVEVRLADPRRWSLDPYFIVSYEHQFIPQGQSIPVALAYLPTQSIPTSVYAGQDAVKVVAGTSFDLGRGWSGALSAYGLIGSRDYNGYGADAAVSYQF